MKIIRWLLSHFILILLIVAVIYGYMFWGNLAGKDTPAGKALAYLSDEFVEVEEFVNAVKAKQAKLSAEKQSLPDSKADAPPVATVANDTDESLQLNSTVATQAIEQPPVTISYSHNKMRISQNSDGVIEKRAEAPAVVDRSQIKQGVEAATNSPGENSPAENTPGKTEQASETSAAVVDDIATQDKFISRKVEQQLNNVDKNGNVINKPLQGEAIRDSWITARKSFYQRNYELSEKSYRDVIANTTDNFDAYGELGNVYFNQGKKEQAASAYYEAASILVRKGQLRRAKSLMGLLRHLDKNKAEDLQKLIGQG